MNPLDDGATRPDPKFSEPRLARLYDAFESDRDDLEHYAAIVDEFAARSVIDIGCGTGTFACMLARRGVDVVGVDPAGASLDVAKRKPGAHRVRWVHGDATSLPPLRADLAVMTGNVAQVFVTDADWSATLRSARAALRPGGRLVFETRVPARRAWREWNREQTWSRVDRGDAGVVESWTDLLDLSGSQVTFRGTFVFESDGTELTSLSTLRFRERDEITDSLTTTGFTVDEVRDAPDRPGREWVFIARNGTGTG